MAAFEEMGVLPEITRALDEMEWVLPTDVQAEAIPLILGGGDVLMAAETGNGKTGAFCIPVLQLVLETLKNKQLPKLTDEISSTWILNGSDSTNACYIIGNGLLCHSQHQKEWHGCRANKGIQGSGKYYYEIIVKSEGLCRVGWSTPQAALNLGTDIFGWGYGGTGKKSNGNKFIEYGESFSIHDAISCTIDLDNGEISFWKNGVDLGTAFYLNSKEKLETFLPAVVMKNVKISINFGTQPFKYPLSSDYVAICNASENYVVNSSLNKSETVSTAKQIKNGPLAIIIEPNLELAEQTYNQIEKFKKYIKNPEIKNLLLVGGESIKVHKTALNHGVDIVVGTPGRLEALVENGYLSLNQCKYFILDEADGLLKQNYENLINKLHRLMINVRSDETRLQMVVCSASLHAIEVKNMAERLMHFPVWIDLRGEDVIPETVHHVVVIVDPRKDNLWQKLRRHITTDGVHNNDNIENGNTAEALSEAVKILKGEYCLRAIKEHKMDSAMIFCRTKLDCDNLESYLNLTGDKELTCVCLHSDRKPIERKNNLNRFKQKEVKFLICTDVAARGLDVINLPFIINITLPDDKTNYLHRIGRVGRAERMGLAISLVANVPEKVWYHGNWCLSRGRNCNQTNLLNQRGCCIWYNEQRLLADIEDHLNITIQQIENDIKVPINDFDGKVTYGEKQIGAVSNYEHHVEEMAPIATTLATLESQAQIIYLRRRQTIR
ncbi:PREDICTED: ATP-dependent RNA helicase Ddx1 [Ceratosolen solmsi marchali]|uniref:ATP-dependent RNA helicase n=1 Tax=Ceratosolen solmsi marchali TaxID=326594 RepID=A0AAJ7DXH7_9HYME|nr:PREDICTED: ATP-dependent RNA helicase Ddx1 [Ceratosolen solmsi marchali]